MALLLIVDWPPGQSLNGSPVYADVGAARQIAVGVVAKGESDGRAEIHLHPREDSSGS